MTEWLRPLAPLGYLVGVVLVIDQVAFVISQGPYDLGSAHDRFRLAMLVASRLSALAIGLYLLGGAAILAGRVRNTGTWVSAPAGLVVLVVALTIVLALAAEPELALPAAQLGNPDYILAARASRYRIIVTGLAGAGAVLALARAVRIQGAGVALE